MSNEVITVMYPDAIFINEDTYDVEVTYSNFVKENDNNKDYSTLDIYKKLYDGFWLEDLDETTVSYELKDKEGNCISPLIFKDLQLQMWSLNSKLNEPGEYVAPADSIDENETEYYYAEQYDEITYNDGTVIEGPLDAGQPVKNVSNEDKGVIYSSEKDPNKCHDSLKIRVGTAKTYYGGGRMWAVPTIYTPDPKTDTTIKKTVVHEDGKVDGFAENGETVIYNLAVTNNLSIPAVNVNVRDSILENLDDYPYITYNDDIASDNSTVASGDITKGTYTLDRIPANSTVNVTYSLTFGTIPSDIDEIANLSTDNSDEPSTCIPDDIDCSEHDMPTDTDKAVDSPQNQITQPTEMPDTGIGYNFLSHIPIIKLFL